MNCIDFAINDVVNGTDIDDYLLKLAFDNPNSNYGGNWYNYGNQVSVEQGIREKVIHPIVLPRCKVLGGVTENIDLSGSRLEYLGMGNLAVNVPDFVTGGRKIVSVLEVYQGAINTSVGLGINFGTAACGQSIMNDSLGSFIGGLSSSRDIPQTYTHITPTGNNSFVIHQAPMGLISLSAKVIMEFDDAMSNISPRHYPVFAKIVRLAVKSYIFKTCRRPTDEAVQRSGIPLDSIRDDIADYRGAWDDFVELAEGKWAKCMGYNDTRKTFDAVNIQTQRRI